MFTSSFRIYLLTFISIGIFSLDLLALEEKISGHTLQIKHAEKAHLSGVTNAFEAQANLRMDLELEARTIPLILQKNQGLIDSQSDILLDNNIQVYKGSVEGLPSSWVRITMINDIAQGIIFDGESVLLLKPLDEVVQDFSKNLLADFADVAHFDNNMPVVIDIEDIEHNALCALHEHQNIDVNDLLSLAGLDDTDADIDHDPLVQRSAARTISISLYADTEFVERSNNAVADMIAHLNFADGVFSEQLDIQLNLEDAQGLSDNGTLTDTDAVTLLRAFQAKGLPNPGLSHLFTGKEIDGGTVGVAFVGRLCNSFAVGLTQRFGALTDIVFAHELGHNFGSPHDNQSDSACEASPSGYIMNPSVNGGGPSFSACSVSQMLPVIDRSQRSYEWCITEQSIPTVTILSEPNETANVGKAYRYDSDNIINVRGNAPFSYTLDIGPEGMRLDENGLLEWTPGIDDLGEVFVQITVANDVASDTQSFSVTVSEVNTEGAIDFSEYEIQSYAGSSQDKSGGATIGDDSSELILQGNTWKKIAFEYTVTHSTVLEFEFESSQEGELHGIGFDNDERLTEGTMFTIFGTDDWGIDTYRYQSGSGKVTMLIPVGFYFQGSFDRLIFMNDNDRNKAGVDSRFSNVRLYESDSAIEPAQSIDFNQTPPVDYLPGQQDMRGTASVIESGAGIELVGNKWQTIEPSALSVNKNTFLEFEFKSDSTGEIHGIGFFEGSKYTSKRMFMLHGTQSWGYRSFKYTGNGEYQRFIIPLGKYFTSDSASMVFMNDHDVSEGSANSSFRNIKFY